MFSRFQTRGSTLFRDCRPFFGCYPGYWTILWPVKGAWGHSLGLYGAVCVRVSALFELEFVSWGG